MRIQSLLSFLTLLLMISFASVNAVLFTPALPEIAKFFQISDGAAQLTITWFLIGYAIGQLIYGPIANRFGRKPALYIGITMQIVSSLVCVLAGYFYSYTILVLGRFFLALGSGVGLKMTFTLVNDIYEPRIASQKLSYLIIAFAITPAIGVMIGSFLSAHFGWASNFYASAIYGVVLFLLITRLPETKKELDMNAFQLRHLVEVYVSQFKNLQLVVGGLLMGSATSFFYLFATIAPFIAIKMMHMDVSHYGTANLLPPVGLVLGSLISAQLSKIFQSIFIIKLGISIAMIGSMLMFILLFFKLSPMLVLFIPMMLCYLGAAFIFANGSSIAMSTTADKAHGSAVMNFINMGLVTITVLSIGKISISPFLLPGMFVVLCIFMAILIQFLLKETAD